MQKKFDIIIAGSGPSAQALSSACAAENLRVLLISPTLHEHWIPNYASWLEDIEALGLQMCIEESWASPVVHFNRDHTRELPFRYAKLSTPQLQTILEIRASRGGVQTLCEKVISVDHSEKESHVSLSNGDVIHGRVFVDATGSGSSFVTRHGGLQSAHQMAYGLLMEVEENHWERGEMSLMDYRIPNGLRGTNLEMFLKTPTFLYALPLGKRLVFLEETSLVSRPALSLTQLKERLMLRLRSMGIRPLRILDEERCIIQMGGPRPDVRQRAFAFGAAAGLVHPATGYQLTYALQLAPKVAHALRLGLEQGSPKEAVHLAWLQLWPKEKQRVWDMYQFGMEVLCSLSTKETQSFFQSFFSIRPELWKGFLCAQLPVMELAKAMAMVFLEAPFSVRSRLIQHATKREGATLFRSVLGLSYPQ